MVATGQRGVIVDGIQAGAAHDSQDTKAMRTRAGIVFAGRTYPGRMNWKVDGTALRGLLNGVGINTVVNSFDCWQPDC